MEKITNIQQATDYIYDQIKELNPDVEKNDVYETIMDEIIESAEYSLDDEDVKFLEDNEKDLQVVDKYLQKKIPEYQEFLSEIVADMIDDTMR